MQVARRVQASPFDEMNLAKMGEFPPDEYQKQPVIVWRN